MILVSASSSLEGGEESEELSERDILWSVGEVLMQVFSGVGEMVDRISDIARKPM